MIIITSIIYNRYFQAILLRTDQHKALVYEANMNMFKACKEMFEQISKGHTTA